MATSSSWRAWTARGLPGSTCATTHPGRGRVRGRAAGRIVLQPQDPYLAGRLAVVFEEIEAILKDEPNEEVGLVADGPVMALGGQGNPLLGLRKRPPRRADALSPDQHPPPRA